MAFAARLRACPFLDPLSRTEQYAERCAQHPQERQQQFEKTTLCRFFSRKGGCDRGEGCQYAHGEGELRDKPDLRKTHLCKLWAKGRCCRDSRDCPWAHGSCELQAPEKEPEHHVVVEITRGASLCRSTLARPPAAEAQLVHQKGLPLSLRMSVPPPSVSTRSCLKRGLELAEENERRMFLWLEKRMFEGEEDEMDEDRDVKGAARPSWISRGSTETYRSQGSAEAYHSDDEVFFSQRDTYFDRRHGAFFVVAGN